MKKIYNENLIKSLQILLNKKEEKFTEDYFMKISCLAFSKMNKDGKQIYLIDELLNFKNLKNLSIVNSRISLQDIMILINLEQIEDITFNHCFFEKDAQNALNYIKKLKKLSLKNCFLNDYSRMFNEMDLISLEIIFPYNEQVIEIDDLKNMVNLQYLTLEGCNIQNETNFKKLQKLEQLYLISTEVRELSFINEMANLNKIYLSPKYLQNININNYKARILTSGIDLVIDDENYSKGLV